MMKQIHWKYWEKKRLKFNLITILGGIVCLIISRMLNSASVNFFMLPLIIAHLLLLNIIFTVTYLYNDNVSKGGMQNAERVYKLLVYVALLTDILAAFVAVITIPHR